MEWEIATRSEIPMAMLIQDYDWADEILHAQIGRKWLVPEFGGSQQTLAAGQEMMIAWRKSQEKMLAWSEQKEWWPQFIEEVPNHLS
jgi:hypothetical protein